MAKKQSSPEMSSTAGRIMGGGHPLDNEQLLLSFNQELSRQGFVRPAADLDSDNIAAAREALRIVFDTYFQNMMSLAASVLSQDEQGADDDGNAGTHAYDMLAALAEHDAATTETLIHMIAATVLSLKFGPSMRPGKDAVAVIFSPLDMDAMLKHYEMTATHEGVITTVRITRRETPLAEGVMAQSEDVSNAQPQAMPMVERKYWFFNSTTTGRIGPEDREDVEARLQVSDDLTARLENRACPRRFCPSSDVSTECAACRPSP
jgi:hypothetical protein